MQFEPRFHDVDNLINEWRIVLTSTKDQVGVGMVMDIIKSLMTLRTKFEHYYKHYHPMSDETLSMMERIKKDHIMKMQELADDCAKNKKDPIKELMLFELDNLIRRVEAGLRIDDE